MHKKKYYWIQVSIFLVMIILSGCGSSKGLPMQKADNGVFYFFPKIGVIFTRSFDAEITEDKKSTDYYYQKHTMKLLKNSGYFLDVSTQNRPYMIRIKYQQYVYTGLSDELLSLLSPINALFGPTLEMGVEMNIDVIDHKKVIEHYHYEKEFEAKRDDVKKIGRVFFDDSMDQFLKTMANQSKLKRITIKPQ